MKITTHKLLLCLALSALLPGQMRAADRATIRSRVPLEARRQMLRRLPAANRLELAIGLPQRNYQALTNLLLQLYDARSTNFHQYLTPEQFTEQFGPTVEDYEKVKAFARSNHLTIVREFSNRALVNVAGNVSDIENMFQVHLGTYQHPTENRQFFAPDVEPTVDLGRPILFIDGMDNYVIPKPHGHRIARTKVQTAQPAGGSGGSGLYLGNDFRNAYLPGTSLNGSGQILGVFELGGYTTGDIQLYENLAHLPSVPLNNILTNLPPDSGNDEVASDIELAIAMAPGLAGINVYEATNNGGHDTTLINEMASPSEGETRPSQISCSWGIESDTNIIPGLLELAIQGQSFLYAIGDNGAYQNGVNTNTDQPLIYMVTVGGTQLFMTNNGAAWQSERVWDDNPGTNFQFFSSTGGILTQVPIPDYQKNVSMALNQGSTQFRDVPDVALVARDIEIVSTGTNNNGVFNVTGQPGSWVGTSAAAPLWTGIIACVNQQAANKGKPPVGFLLPAIYNIAESSAYAACFHDITVGSNSWSNPATGRSSGGRYTAAVGYDLCTGWGTVASANFINTLLDFSGPVFVDFNFMGSPNKGTYANPYGTLAQGVTGVSPGGTIIFKTAGTSAETMKITKPMNMNVNDGQVTIGH